MVGFQDSLFPFQPHVNILCCDRLQVRRDAQGHPDTFQRMPQNLAHCVEVAGELVHIGGRAVTKIVETDVRKFKMPDELSKISRHPISALRGAVRFGYEQVIVVVCSSAGLYKDFLLVQLIEPPQEIVCPP